MPLLMLVQDPPEVQSFAQLYELVLSNLHHFGAERRITTVLGPMTAGHGRSFQDNMQALLRAAHMLDNKGWGVVELTSFQLTVERIRGGMAHAEFLEAVLEDFTLPLLRCGRLHAVHFMRNYEESAGALREYGVALDHYGPWNIHFV